VSTSEKKQRIIIQFNSVQFLIYLRAELNSQWPAAESAQIQTAAIRQRKTKQTKRNNKTTKIIINSSTLRGRAGSCSDNAVEL
jgi:hypothetical protein